MSSLKVVVRKSTGALTISGTVRTAAGTSVRVQRRANTADRRLAKEEAARLAREIYHSEELGRGPDRPFAEAVKAYLEAEPRSDATIKRFQRVVRALGDVPLSAVDQDSVTLLRNKLMRPGHRSATVTREIINPLRAALRLAQERGWCTAAKFRVARETEGRTLYILPDEARRLIAAAAPHLRPLIVFLLGTGARLSEALYLEWRDVDLVGGRAIFWADRTKAGKRRNAFLPPTVVAALANLPERDGMVFRRPDGQPYEERTGTGGQIKRAFASAVARAGLDPELTPHCLRHSFATWFYALYRDPLRLKAEGGWSSLNLVERYAHLMNDGYQEQIRQFWGMSSVISDKVA